MSEKDIVRFSDEMAWVVCHAIIDSDDDELKSISIGQLVKIRDIVSNEANALLSDMSEKNKEITRILNSF